MTSRVKSINNYLFDYLYQIRSKGRFSFTFIELQKEFDVSVKALQQNLYRLKGKKQIAQIRQGFYVIIPPEYSHRGILPIYLFINDLMEFLNRDYYVGLFSAAALHGSGHQQPMRSYIITKKPALRAIKNEKLVINFSIKNEWSKNAIIKKKTDAGYINVSSPELTALDLVSYNHKIGGMNRIFTVIEELTENIKPSLLLHITREYNQITSIQRLGFMLDELGYYKLSDTLLKVLQKQNFYNIPLSVLHKEKTGDIDKKWKIISNIKLNN